MNETLILSTAITIGLVGSFHCAGMCGPIALALPLNKKSKMGMIFSSILYNLGRAITYSAFGFVFGLIGLGFKLSGFQQWASIVMGSIMILSVIFPALFKDKFNIERFSYSFVGKLQMKLRKLFQKQSYTSLFFIGLLNGLLPCGLVYVALFAAIGTGGAFSGALFMFVFGLGTLPMMFALSIFGNIIGTKLRTKINRLTPVVVVIIGLLFVLRGANLGIMFLSPPEKMLSPHKKMDKNMMKTEKKNQNIEKITVF